MDGCGSKEGEEGRQSHQSVEETHRDQQHHHLRAAINIIFAKILFINQHLEECADESEVLIGKDDHTQEGGESSVKDMGAGPEMSIVLISRLP